MVEQDVTKRGNVAQESGDGARGELIECIVSGRKDGEWTIALERLHQSGSLHCGNEGLEAAVGYGSVNNVIGKEASDVDRRGHEHGVNHMDHTVRRVDVCSNDLRLVNFADALARCGYVAFVPEFTNLKEFRVRPSDVDEVVAAFRHCRGLPTVDPARVGIFGFSYAGGLAVLAAADPRIADDVRFCFLLGSYYDLRDIVNYATTGYYREDGEWVYMEPRHTGKWAFLKNMLELVDDAGDRRLLSRIADAKLDREGADMSATADSLGPEGAQLYALMMNRDPDSTGGIIDGLSPRILEYFDALSLPGNIDNVKAALLIVHGRDDNLMPYTESIRLAENAPPGAEVHLTILKSFQHVDLKFDTEGGPAGWWRAAQELGRVFSVGYELLAQGLL